MKIALLIFASFLALIPVRVYSQNASTSIKWETIESKDDGFSITVPESFQYSRSRLDGKGYEGRGEYLSDGLYLYVFVDPINVRRQSDIALNFVAAHRQVGFVEHIGGQTITRYEFEGGDGYFHSIIFSKTDTTSFAFHAVSREAQDPSATRFIRSIRFSPANNEELKAEPEEQKADSGNKESELKLEMRPDPAIPSSGSGSGSGYGSGAGNGSRSGTFPTNLPQIEKTPLKVVYKQKAKYTDWARFYNISGNVTLRVTFNSDNTIGSIVKIRSLPFGLTEQAIIAARGMRFEAEKVNGTPRTTTRPVSFQFNIY